MSLISLFVSAPRGFGDLVVRELESFGATEVREQGAGVRALADLRTAYRACLESRIANRIFLQLARFEAASADDFYREARNVAWQEHVSPSGTLACEFTGRHPAIHHSHFGALRLKDAICDVLRERSGHRPDIAVEQPDVRVHAHAHGAQILLLLDLSGESLHRRGYRTRGGDAPLKENLAAAILMRAGWGRETPELRTFVDPMCGSGTFVIEAALIATERAPGLGRRYFGFLGWRGHDAALWQAVHGAAEARAAAGLAAEEARITAGGPRIHGSDRDPHAVRLAATNAAAAGVGTVVQLEQMNLAQRTAPADARAGLVCTNPPYGMRLDDLEGARQIFRELGELLRARFSGWDAAILSGAPQLGLELGIRAWRAHTVWNGAIECRLLRLRVSAPAFVAVGRPPRSAAQARALRDSPGAQMLANRLAKNQRQLKRWLARENVTCYRLYDADMPEYAFAIDLYREIEAQALHAVVQEYAAPASIAADAVQRRRNEALAVLPEALGLAPGCLHLRTRRRSSAGEQYTRRIGTDDHDERNELHRVAEGGLKFLVNFADYLDTGLFLDHRLTRARIRSAARERRVLNLFCYTGSATVYAAAGGAIETTSVDLSSRYLEWAQRNLGLNGFHAARHGAAAHRLVQGDCREWLAAARERHERWELIFLDPPTFSNSKRMTGVLDLQRDHSELIDACIDLLAPGGELLFSTNAQRFKLDPDLSRRHRIEDLTPDLLPPDFARQPRIHRVYRIEKITASV